MGGRGHDGGDATAGAGDGGDVGDGRDGADGGDGGDGADVTCTDTGRALVVTVTGDLDVLTAPRLRSVLEPLCGRAQVPVVVDLGAVTFLGSHGLAVLADVHELARGRSVDLRVVTGGSRLVERPLQITGLSGVLALYADLGAAVDHPGTSARSARG